MPDPRDVITSLYERRMSDLSQQLTSGQIDLSTWQITMRSEIRDAFLLQQRAGAGRDLTADEYLKLGNPIKAQDKYLAQFARDIKDGNVSPDAVASRAKMYARASRSMFSIQATDGLDLPGQPGIGTDCKVNCKCDWRIVYNDDGSVDAFWQRHVSDSCPTCKQRALDWNPFHTPARSIEKAA